MDAINLSIPEIPVNRSDKVAKRIVVATAIATILYILMAFVSAKAAWPTMRTMVPYGYRPTIVSKPVRGLMVVPRGPTHRGVGGYYWHKTSKTWRHDGGTYPDTNYHEANKEREYIQLEDPEGVWERTHAK